MISLYPTAGTCGGTLHSRSGFLSSPDSPNAYPENVNCTWTIVGPVGHFITFRFSRMQIYNPSTNATCSNSSGWLEIRDFNSTGQNC